MHGLVFFVAVFVAIKLGALYTHYKCLHCLVMLHSIQLTLMEEFGLLQHEVVELVLRG